MALIERRVSDRAMLKLLRSWLRAGIIEGGVYSDIESGTPQGSPISPLLCNIALSVLDEELAKAKVQTGNVIRYADDWVVLCPTRERAEMARSDCRGGSGTDSGCVCIPTRPGSSTSPEGQRASTFWVPQSHVPVLEVARSLLPPAMAIASGHGLYQGQGSRDDRSALWGHVARCCRGKAQPRTAGLVWLLPTWQLIAEVQHRRPYVNERMAIFASNKYGLSGRNWATRFNYGGSAASGSTGSLEQ